MYGAGPQKISEQVTKDGGRLSVPEAKAIIKEYFNTFWKLEDWIEEQRDFIEKNGHTYSFFGRKRRLDAAKDKENKGIQGHAVRSGLNFLVQSAASDINLIGAVDANEALKQKGLKAKIFALVHDSILAEVPESEVEEYCEILRQEVQKNRGIQIPGCPIGIDIDIGDDYSMGKFTEKYASSINV